MNGNEFLLDTNILIYALKGVENTRSYFETEPYISVITEIEILGLNGISENEIAIRQTAIEYCKIIPLTQKIIKKAIEIKRIVKVKMPDAIIAATAMEEDFILVTTDKGFRKIKKLRLVILKF